MGRYIMKADNEHDLYVEWSTVVDAPVKYGPAEDFLDLNGDRKARCDETGTTMHDSDWGGWEDKGMIVHNMGNRHGFYWLERGKLYDFIAALNDAPEDRDVQQAALDTHTKEIIDDEDED